MLVLARLVLVVVACGVLVVSRVLIVQGNARRASRGTRALEAPLPMTFGRVGADDDGAHLAHDYAVGSGASSSSSSGLSIRRRRRKAVVAAAATAPADHDFSNAALRPGRLHGARVAVGSKLRHWGESLRTSRRTQPLFSLLARLPQGFQRGEDRLGALAERWMQKWRRHQAGLADGAGLQGAQGAAAAASLDGVDPQYLPLLQSLEAEGHKALDDNEEDWHRVSEKDDTKVWRRMMAEDVYGREYPCLKLSTVLHAPPDAVMALLVDSGRVGEYNKYSRGRHDVEQVGPNTKIVRNRTLPPLQKRAHEFCTVMHVIRRPDGSQVMLTKYTEHPEVPRSSEFARSEIILGVTEVRPHPTDPNRAQLTTVSHVKSTGVPAFIAEKFSVRGVMDFAESLRQALYLSKKESAPVMVEGQGQQHEDEGEERVLTAKA